MTHTTAAARHLAHAAEHDRGECPVDCTSTADEFRAYAAEIDRNAARRFAALDETSRGAYVRAARTFTETQELPQPGEDAALVYARYHGRLLSALGELLDLVGLAPEE